MVLPIEYMLHYCTALVGHHHWKLEFFSPRSGDTQSTVELWTVDRRLVWGDTGPILGDNCDVSGCSLQSWGDQLPASESGGRLSPRSGTVRASILIKSSSYCPAVTIWSMLLSAVACLYHPSLETLHPAAVVRNSLLPTMASIPAMPTQLSAVSGSNWTLTLTLLWLNWWYR